MELSTLLILAGSLACPIVMGVMMWLMSKNMGGQSGQTMSDPHPSATSKERLAALRAQQQAVEAEIAEVTHLAELETQREALRGSKTTAPVKAGATAAQSAD
jgi:hypothetical protein